MASRPLAFGLQAGIRSLGRRGDVPSRPEGPGPYSRGSESFGYFEDKGRGDMPLNPFMLGGNSMRNPLEDLKGEQLGDLLRDTASRAGAARIMQDGYRYVDAASYCQWMRDSYPRMFQDGLEHWMAVHPDSARVFFQTKGFEWDVFRSYHPHFVDVNQLSTDVTDRVKDLASFDPVSMHVVPIQVKAPLSQSGIAKEVERLFNHYPPDTKFAVTQSVYEKAVQQGMPPDRFVQVVPDDNVRAATEERYHQAVSGHADPPGVTLGGTLAQVGKGAVLGAVIYVGTSALSNYSRYKAGEIDYDEYANAVVKDGTKGAILGGSMAAINVGVQYAATTIGVAAPITIPVMLVIGVALRKVVDPMFGDGQYAEVLSGMQFNKSLELGWDRYGKLSLALYDTEVRMLEEMRLRAIRGEALKAISSAYDRQLETDLGEE